LRQLSLSLKSPLTCIEVTISAAAPLFCNVIVCAALVVPMAWLSNVSAVGLAVADVRLVPAFASGACQMPRHRWRPVAPAMTRQEQC
jgi:hypothetical protein